ncbi:THO complex subunit 5B-like [Lathyrus oleraceus]|uniref:THO complex subunit 5B-like n=1 Tax=Pisum sativum TaxID=3888 RepID=UPI0021CE88F1|nr:THO complex subunit 5B-like [Pisum sativum]
MVGSMTASFSYLVAVGIKMELGLKNGKMIIAASNSNNNNNTKKFSSSFHKKKEGETNASQYLKAVKACKYFKSKYPDIELVPEEEFLRDAPKDIKDSFLSKDSAHNLMLKRLNLELYQHRKLCKHHAKLEQPKKVLLDTIANRKKFLTSLPSHLKSLEKASLPVQNQLGIMHTKKLKQHHSAELLPPTLYVIYSQLLTHQEAFVEPIDLKVVGSLKGAPALARKQTHKETEISTVAENSKLEDDVPDDEEDGQRCRKRPRRVQVREGSNQGGISKSST